MKANFQEQTNQRRAHSHQQEQRAKLQQLEKKAKLARAQSKGVPATPAPPAAPLASAIGEAKQSWRDLRKVWRQALRKWWLEHTLKPRGCWDQVRCAFNFHDDEAAQPLDREGHPIIGPGVPPHFARCRRPKCLRYTEKPVMFEAGPWVELDSSWMVLCRKDCRACFGRGYKGRMHLDGGGTIPIPCNCVQVQPKLVKLAAPAKEAKK